MLIAVRCLLAEPNPKDPLVVDIVSRQYARAVFRGLPADSSLLACVSRVMLAGTKPIVCATTLNSVSAGGLTLLLCGRAVQAEECASQPELFKMKAKQHVAQHARPAGTQLQQHAAGPTVDQRQSCPAQVVGEQGRALLAGGDTCAAGAAVTETAAAAAAGTEVAAAAARSGGNSAGAGQTAAASNT